MEWIHYYRDLIHTHTMYTMYIISTYYTRAPPPSLLTVVPQPLALPSLTPHCSRTPDPSSLFILSPHCRTPDPSSFFILLTVVVPQTLAPSSSSLLTVVPQTLALPSLTPHCSRTPDPSSLLILSFSLSISFCLSSARLASIRCSCSRW